MSILRVILFRHPDAPRTSLVSQWIWLLLLVAEVLREELPSNKIF